ncbi:PAS domain-containing sensor histidine kinase [Hyphomicrobium sp.]|uniref:sensor histidine kinase NtrY-like n=1 Tax=Hyphomicrobium sp. TaxID=82 RepID=UPI002D76A79D|nr:PAS domain-containing sensor histidine kinase [Hyphomicrobium sp.]HET6388150.1 PAS domain-containing sensor histidine kinase [Hyphomicrobium sp.]
MSASNSNGKADTTAPRDKVPAAALVEEGATPLNPSNRAFWFGLGVVLLSLISALVSYLILTGLTAITPRNEYVWAALAVNGVLIVAMFCTIVWQALGLRRAWKQKVPGARLHTRIVALFTLTAALPAVLLAVAATTTFSRSLDGWFSGRTRAIVENSYDVAKAYVDEHSQIIRTDIVNMVRDINGEAATLNADTEGDAFQKFLIGQAGLRDLTSAYVIDAEGVPIVLALDDPKLPYVVPPPAAIQQAESGQVALSRPSSDYRISAIAKIDSMPGRYLYVARGVSPKVIGHLQSTEQNVYEYTRLRQAKGGLKAAHGLIYFMISMTSLLAAIWVGMWFAGRFVAPIRRLIAGAQEVSKGNLEFALPEIRGEGDLRRLSHTFNVMTRDLKQQQSALVATNAQLTERRNFIEAVLSGVSAGVIGLDSADRITLISRSAEGLLGFSAAGAVGKPMKDVIPEFAPVLASGEEPGSKNKQYEIQKQIGDEERTFAVRITHERAGEGDVGSVVTFDDISELVQAQRTSAWADVARRIAHEIKNPLTPIQLSAERLRRKFGTQIGDNRELFETLTQTIERQTGQIKSMVDEFASFARMPQPVMADQDLRLAVQEPAILFREGHKDLDFKLVLPEAPVTAHFDLRLISQAVTNLIKNGAEAIESFGEAQGRPPDYKGQIEVRLVPAPDRVAIEVIDNGIGLPKQNRAKLLEPYVTTRAKGTGLGLAIVQKVVEQHGGSLALEDAPVSDTRKRGALVRLTLPIRSGPSRGMPPNETRSAVHIAGGA